MIIFPCHSINQNSSTSDLSFSQVSSVEKRKSRKNFSASAYGLRLKKLFLGFLFSTSVTWRNSNQTRNNFTSYVTWKNIKTKYYFSSSANFLKFCILLLFFHTIVLKLQFCNSFTFLFINYSLFLKSSLLLNFLGCA